MKPLNFRMFDVLRRQIDESIARGGKLDGSCKPHVQKQANAAENAFADRAILLDENLLLFEQNNEKTPPL